MMPGYRPRRGDWGLDYSGYRADPNVLRNIGAKFVCRYLCYDTASTSWKIIRASEAAALGAVGIAVVLNFEWYGTRMVDPNVADKFQAGVADARQAVAQAQALGHPKGAWIVFSCDTGITAAQLPMAIQYMRGAESVCEPAGFNIDGYGGLIFTNGWAADRVARGKLTLLDWQSFAWSGGVITAYTDIFQHLGHPHFDSSLIGGPSATDENEVVSDSAALMWVPGSDFTDPGSGPVPDPTPAPGAQLDMADFIVTDGNDLLVVGPGGVMPVTDELLDVYFNADGSSKIVHKGDLSGLPKLASRVRFFLQNGVWPTPGGSAPSMALMTSTVQAAVKPIIPTPLPPPTSVNLNPGQVVKIDPTQVIATKIVDPPNLVASITASVVAGIKASGIPATVDPVALQAAVEEAVKHVFATAKVVEKTTDEISFMFG